MAIYGMLDGMDLDEPSVKAVTTAYEVVFVELGLVDRRDPLTIAVASKIMALSQSEVCDADRLIELTLKEFGSRPPRGGPRRPDSPSDTANRPPLSRQPR